MAKPKVLSFTCLALAACGASGAVHTNLDGVPRCDTIYSALPHDIAQGRGPWALGFRSNTSSPFTPYTSFSTSEPGFAGSDGVAWWYAGTANWPCAAMNTNSKVISYADITLQPGQFFLHPGAAGEQSIARWTAYRAGTVEIRAGFSGISRAPTTTDAHVFLNNARLAEGGINVGGSGNLFTYVGPVDVVVGDTIDLAVGYGNGDYACDSTALNVSICAL